MQEQTINFENEGLISSLINTILYDATDELGLSYDEYQATRSRSNTARREIEGVVDNFSRKKITEYFNTLIKDPNLFLKVNNGSSSYGHNYPRDTYMKPISISVEDLQLNRSRHKVDRSKLSVLTLSITLRVVYNSLILNEIENLITLNEENYNGNMIRGNEIDIFSLARPGYIYNSKLESDIKELKNALHMKHSEAKNLEEKIDNANYILDFMNKHNIKYEKISAIKSKMLLEIIKGEENDEIVLTNLNEIIDLTL